MALSRATLVAINAAVSAATGNDTVKMTALAGLIDACLAELGTTGALTANMQQHVADIKAEYIANVATFVTSIGT